MREYIKLLEFSETGCSVKTAYDALSAAFGKLDAMGDKNRIYEVGDAKGVIYMNDIGMGFGIAWNSVPSAISTIYVWYQLDPDRSPDYAIDIPENIVFTEEVAQKIVNMIKKKHMGAVDV